jgi:hypothetical protein
VCRRHWRSVSLPQHTAGARVSLKVHAFAPLALSLTVIGATQQVPVPMDEEPHHHVLLKNEFVEVVRATIPPGESTLFHTHSHDSAGFDLVKTGKPADHTISNTRCKKDSNRHRNRTLPKPIPKQQAQTLDLSASRSRGLGLPKRLVFGKAALVQQTRFLTRYRVIFPVRTGRSHG